MAAWVLFKNGQVRKYNECGSFTWGDSLVLRQKSESDGAIAKFDSREILGVEYSQPCAVYESEEKYLLQKKSQELQLELINQLIGITKKLQRSVNKMAKNQK